MSMTLRIAVADDELAGGVAFEFEAEHFVAGKASHNGHGAPGSEGVRSFALGRNW